MFGPVDELATLLELVVAPPDPVVALLELDELPDAPPDPVVALLELDELLDAPPDPVVALLELDELLDAPPGPVVALLELDELPDAPPGPVVALLELDDELELAAPPTEDPLPSGRTLHDGATGSWSSSTLHAAASSAAAPTIPVMRIHALGIVALPLVRGRARC